MPLMLRTEVDITRVFICKKKAAKNVVICTIKRNMELVKENEEALNKVLFM